MHEIVNRYFLAWEKFMPESHSRQLRFTYSACEPFPKHQEKI